MTHAEPSYLAGQTVRIKSDVFGIGGLLYHVEDWWDRVYGKSWTRDRTARHYHAQLTTPVQ